MASPEPPESTVTYGVPGTTYGVPGTPTVSPRLHLNDKRWAIVVVHKARLAVDKRFELLHPIEDRLDTHLEALPVLMKRGNSILAEACLRMRYFLLRTNRLPVLNHRILRNNLKMGPVRHVLFSADLDFPSRLHYHLALTLAGRGDGEAGREDPPVEPEPSPFTDPTPTDSAEEPTVIAFVSERRLIC
jgi:hypothetical protein